MYGATIGKNAILAVEGATNQAVCACTCIEGFEKHYLQLLLNALKTEFIDSGEGGAQPNISRIKIRSKPIPLPPLEEQKEIVRIVDQLKEEVDILNRLTEERKKKKAQFVTSSLHHLTDTGDVQHWNLLKDHFHDTLDELGNVKKLRETILQLAVQGKLTAKWRLGHPELIEGDHSAAALLEKIKAEKEKLIAEKKIKKEKPLPEITDDEKPYELPECWEWVRLRNVLLYSDAGKSPDCEKRPVSGSEWGVLTTTSIQQNKFNQVANKVLPAKFEINPSQIVEAGDILITRAGPINRTGIACKVDKIDFNLILSDKTIRLKYISELLYPDFIVMALNSNEIRNLLLNKMIGMASSQVNISQSNIKGITFPFPPLLEQKEIVRQVDHLMSLCDQLETHITTRNTSAEQLMKAVVGEVLGG